MKKILFFIQLPPPLHGVTTINQYVYYFVKNSKYYDVSLLPISYSDNISQLNQLNLLKLIAYLKYLKKLYHHIKKQKPEYIYFTIVPSGKGFYRDFLFVLIIKYLNVRPIYHLHGQGIGKSCNNIINKYLYNFTFSNSNVIHLSKGLLEREFHNLKLKNTRLDWIENGIEKIDYYSKTKSSKVRLLFLSNLFESKGIFIFLESLSLIDNKYYEKIEVNIVGEIPDEEIGKKLNVYNEKLRPNINIRFHGKKTGEEKTLFFANSDIFIHPTLNDSFPLVILEAMQFGIAIIGTEEGAIPEIIDDGINGLIVKKNKPSELAEKIVLLIDDKYKRGELGDAAMKKFLNNYTLDCFKMRIKNYFEKEVY